jgi:hypothetical protein
LNSPNRQEVSHSKLIGSPLNPKSELQYLVEDDDDEEIIVFNGYAFQSSNKKNHKKSKKNSIQSNRYSIKGHYEPHLAKLPIKTSI